MRFSRSSVLTAAAGFAACVAVGALIAAVRDKPGELPTYVRAAEQLVSGQSIYDPANEPAFSYPPAFALATLPLVPLNEFARRWAWWTMNLALLGGVLLAVRAAVRPALAADGLEGDRGAAGRRRMWIWGAATAALAVRFTLSPLAYQSHDLILLALMTASAVWWTRRRDGRAGAAAGVAAACKATPLLAIAFFLLRRRWAACGGMALAAVAATLAPDALFPNPDGGAWVNTWAERFVTTVSLGDAPDVDQAWERWNPLNQSLAGTIARLTSDPRPDRPTHVAVTLWHAPPAVAKGLTIAAQLAVLGWLAWCAWRPAADDRPADPFTADPFTADPFTADPFTAGQAPPGGLTPGLRCLAELSLTLCGMLLLSPMSSTQHFCFLLPGAAVIAARLVRNRRDRWNVAAAVGLLTVGTLPAKDLIGDAACEAIRSAGGHTACTLIVLAACGRLLVRDRRATAGDSPVLRRHRTNSQAT